MTRTEKIKLFAVTIEICINENPICIRYCTQSLFEIETLLKFINYTKLALFDV